MLTPETIQRHFRGPRRKSGQPNSFHWYQKGRRWPRRSYVLTFVPQAREWTLAHFEKARPSSKGPTGRGHFYHPNSALIATFRACLTPDDIARCVAASIQGDRNA